MSNYLVNPGGRIVAIDDELEYQRLLKYQVGFRVATQEESANYIAEKEALVAKIRQAHDPEFIKLQEQVKNKELWKKGVFLATVAPDGPDGYGVSSEGILKELRELGLDISTTYEKQQVGILFHAPYSIDSIKCPKRIIYTMFESTKIPDDWIPYLKKADLVLVPSTFCQETFGRTGIYAEVLPLGYDDRVFSYQSRPVKTKKQIFSFLHYNAYNLRKGFIETVNAFTKEFDKTEPVKMIFKTTMEDPPIKYSPEEYPNIEVIAGRCPSKELVKILARSDCFVFPSRGEGFGLTPLEAMATGIPAIVPNAHGISEYFDEQYMYEVAVKEECPPVYKKYKGLDVGTMVLCDEEDLAKKMRWVYEHREEAHEKGTMASVYAQNYTMRKTAEKLKNICDNLLKDDLVYEAPGLKVESI